MQNKKVCIYISSFLFIMILSLSVLAAGTYPEPSSKFYVNDFANVIDEEVEDLIVANGSNLDEKTGAQISLVTVDFTDGIAIEEYATELFNKWSLGSAEKNNGLLILLSIGDEDYWTVQGKGLEVSLTSGEISQMLFDYLEPDFDVAEYSKGAAKIYEAFVKRLGGTWIDKLDSQQAEGSSNAEINMHNKYVIDNAAVISNKTAEYIEKSNLKLRNLLGTSMYLVTTKNTGSLSMQDYTYEMFDSSGASARDVLLVLSIEDDDYWLLQGKDIENILTNKVLTDIINTSLEPYFAKKDYDSGVFNTTQALFGFASEYYSKSNKGKQIVPNDRVKKTSDGGNFLGFIFFILVVYIIISSQRRKYYRRRFGIPFNPFSWRRVRRYGPGGYWGRYGPPPLGGGFWYGGRWNSRPKPKSGFGWDTPPTSGPKSSGSGGIGRSSTKSSSWGSGTGGGGFSRGGGAGRSSFGRGFSSGSKPFSGSSKPFGGGSKPFGGGGSFRGGGGMSRGGGAGRRK